MSATRRNYWRPLPRKLRWGIIVLVVLSLGAGIRLGRHLLYSNAPFEAEIATDLRYWQKGEEEREAQGAQASHLLTDKPPIFALRDVERMCAPILRGEDPTPMIDDELQFYERLGPDRLSSDEQRALEPLFAAPDKRVALEDALLGVAHWFAEEGRAAALVHSALDTSVTQPAKARLVTPFAAALCELARTEDPQLALEVALTALETLAQTPKPLPIDLQTTSWRHAYIYERAVLTAVACGPVTAEQIQRHDAVWKALRDSDAINRVVRTEAALMLSGDGRERVDIDALGAYGLYEWAKSFDVRTTPVTTPRTRWPGIGNGRSYLASSTGYLVSTNSMLQASLETASLIFSLRRYEAELGALPESREAWETWAGVDATPVAISMERSGERWEVVGTASWETYSVSVNVVPLGSTPPAAESPKISSPEEAKK